MILLAPRIGNNISYVTQVTDDSVFVWQAQYLLRWEGDIICSTQFVMRIMDVIHFAWQAQYLLSLKGDFTCSAHWK